MTTPQQIESMSPDRRRTISCLLFTPAAAALAMSTMSQGAQAATAAELDRDAAQSLQRLYRSSEVAEDLGRRAKATLVFPRIIKAGLVFGGSYGEGVLNKPGAATDYYNSVSASWGWQVGAESFGYVLFLMTDQAVSYLEASKGWEIGVGPSVVVVNEGMAKNLSTSTLKADAYAFIFDQQGLMASLSIEGTKVSRIKR
jgi:lipid-binding SYLF domain-containing protein